MSTPRVLAEVNLQGASVQDEEPVSETFVKEDGKLVSAYTFWGMGVG